jgi:hypothetical protein
VPLERLRQITAQTRRELEEEKGPLQGWEVLGSAPGEGSQDTVVLMKFARGSVVVRYVWEGDRLRSVRLTPTPPSARTFLPQSATDFAAFSFAVPTVVRVRFGPGSGDAVTQLAVRTKDGNIVAERVKP